jgi:hypothetical protein
VLRGRRELLPASVLLLLAVGVPSAFRASGGTRLSFPPNSSLAVSRLAMGGCAWAAAWFTPDTWVVVVAAAGCSANGFTRPEVSCCNGSSPFDESAVAVGLGWPTAWFVWATPFRISFPPDRFVLTKLVAGWSAFGGEVGCRGNRRPGEDGSPGCTPA